MFGIAFKIKPLSQSSFLRYFSFAVLYVAQGVPEGLMFYALPAWLAKNGLSPAQIGTFVGISLLPWSFKLINGPLMDRFTYLPMGRRRPWVLAGQLGILVSFFLMSTVPDPVNNIVLLTTMGFMVSFFSAFQDVAVDGMAIDILPEDQQARANGLMWGSKSAGIAVSVAVGSILINRYGLSHTIMLFSSIVFLIMLIPLFLREREGERILPWTSGEASSENLKMQLHDWKSIFKNLIRVFFLPMSFIMGIAVFFTSISRGLMDTILPVLTVQELGWADTDYSSIFATSGLISGVIGMFIGGALIDFLGKIRMMRLFVALLICSVIVFSILSSFWDVTVFVSGFIIAFYTLHVLFTIATFASAMQLCWKKVAATQFTLYMTISNLGLSFGAQLLGPLTSNFSYPIVVLVCALSPLATLILLQFIRLETHQNEIVRLENNGRKTVRDTIKDIRLTFLRKNSSEL